MKELGESNMEGAAQPLNPVIPISLQPAQMQTGYTHWMGELLEILRSVMAKHKKSSRVETRTTGIKENQKKRHLRAYYSIVNAVCLILCLLVD